MPIVPVAAWMPDADPLSAGTSEALNVIARSAKSYGPLLGPVTVANPLPAFCQGAFSAEDTTGVSRLYAGTGAKLQELVAGAATWADRSGISYSTPVTGAWRFAQFKNTVVATNGADPIQTITMGGTAFATLSTGAPTAKFVCEAESFLVVGNTYDPVGGTAPFRLWWSALNDPTTWPTPGSTSAQQTQSDYNDFAGPTGAITGLSSDLASASLAIFFEHGIYIGTYVGPPLIFDFTRVQGARGLSAPDSLVQIGGVSYYLGEDGFFAFDGATNAPVGAGVVDRWFWKNANPAYLYRMVGAYDPLTRAIIWAFQSNAAVYGIPDTLLIYVPEFQRWSHASLNVQWLVKALPVSGLSKQPAVGVFTASNQFATLTGPALAASISTLEAMPDAGGGRVWLNPVRPLVDGGSPTVAILSRNRLQDAQVAGPDIAMNAAGLCPQRINARFVQALIKVPAASNWNHCTGAVYEPAKAGMR